MNSKIFYTAVAVALVATMGCESEPKPAPTPTTAAQPAVPVEKPVTNNAPATNSAAAETAAQTNAGGGAFAEIDPATLTETAPDKFSVKFATTAGDFTVDLHRDWAPNGVDRFYNLVKAGYYTDIAAFRVISGFMAQFGIHGDPAVNKVWREAKIQDDVAKPEVSNNVGYLTYAMAGPNTRTVQLFINFGNNKMLDSQGFTPIGQVSGDGMQVVNKWYAGYGEGAPRGKGPDQMRLQTQGNEYLKSAFPEMSYINSVTLVDGAAAPAPTAKPATPATPTKAWEAGAFTQKGISTGDIENGQVKISIKDDGQVSGVFQGSREGKGFSIPFKGTINDKGQVDAVGTKGPNNVDVKCLYKDGGCHGAVQGKINDKGLRVAFAAVK